MTARSGATKKSDSEQLFFNYQSFAPLQYINMSIIHPIKSLKRKTLSEMHDKNTRLEYME